MNKKADMVNRPPHYTFGKYEVIDVLEDWFPNDPLLWQVGKYISRADRKGNPLQDLEKAAYYLNRRIQHLKEQLNHGENNTGNPAIIGGGKNQSMEFQRAAAVQRMSGEGEVQQARQGGGAESGSTFAGDGASPAV